MSINFAAASTAGLNNPGTEIIKIVEGDNRIGYEEILSYIRSGDVPSLFVTIPSGREGELYQFAGYSDVDKQIRFINDKAVIVFKQGVQSFSKEVLSPGSVLEGTTDELTPREVLLAVTSGRPVVIKHTDSTFGFLRFTYFNVAGTTIVSNAIVNLGGAWTVYALSGDAHSEGGTWSGSHAQMSTS